MSKLSGTGQARDCGRKPFKISDHDRDSLAVLTVELGALAEALEVGDARTVRVRLATIAQQIHLLQLTHDNYGQACADVTHVNGALLSRYTAGRK